jgi:hypothetical protein
MRAIGAPEALVTADPPRAVDGRYRRYMVEDARQHPYGSLGAKGVLEHLAITVADEFAAGLLRSGIPNIESGIRFISSHGVLDIEHVRHGDQLIRTIERPSKLGQVLEGAMVTREAFHSFLTAIEEVYDRWAPRWETAR